MKKTFIVLAIVALASSMPGPVCSNVLEKIVLKVTEPTMPHRRGMPYLINLEHPLVKEFVDDTVSRFRIDRVSINSVISLEFSIQLAMERRTSKQARYAALERTIGWCRFWRDTSPRIKHVSPEMLGELSNAQILFRMIKPKSH